MTESQKWDVVIIGAGAAGLSAGLVLVRARLGVLLVDAGEPRNASADEMHGFLSRDGMPPSEFLGRGRAEVVGYGGAFLDAAVVNVDRRVDGAFAVALSDGTVEVVRALLVATGLTDLLPDIPGVRERWGTLVHHCPYCHGFEVRDKTIVVLGGEARALSMKQAGLLRRYSDHVSFLTNGIELTPAEARQLDAIGVQVVSGQASHLLGEPGSLDAVALRDGGVLPCQAVFIAPPQRPNDSVLRSLGCATDPATGLVAVDQFGQTSVPGVWAAGNVVAPTAQVITAAGAGSASAIAISGWLLQQGLDAAPPRLDRD